MSIESIDGFLAKHHAERDQLVARQQQLLRDVDELRWLLSAESAATTRLESRYHALRNRVDALERLKEQRRAAQQQKQQQQQEKRNSKANNSPTVSADYPACEADEGDKAGGGELLEVPADVRAFFIEHCTRSGAVEILARRTPPAFLLRRSSFGNAHALSFVDEEAREPLHCLVLRSDDGCWSLEGESEVYASLLTLLESYGFIGI